MNFLIVCVLFLQLGYIHCESKCNQLTTCGQCVGYSLEQCVWCAQKGKIPNRCQPESYFNTAGKTWCDPNYVQNPKLFQNNTQDLEWRAEYPTVQFRPQNMKIKVRPGVPVPFTVAYKPAKHYPLDVYYLIDNSHTMQTHKDQLNKQAQDIYLHLTKITNNVRFGIGTFVEKPGFPYVNPRQNSYAYEHHLSFTNKTEIFQSALAKIEVGSSNLDDPEAGLDALMQTMVCEEKVGWRKNSSRIIIMFTDNTYHSAGDGKMLGIITPNDMQCHLGADNRYSKALELDYPSVSQINKVAFDKKFTIIFAALSNVSVEYEQLAKRITGANYAELAEQSNVMDIIIKSYKDSVSVKQINIAEKPKNIEIHFDQECTTQTKRNCESTFDHPIINVTVTLTVKSCPIPTVKDGYHQQVILSPTNLNEALTIDVEVDCQCECEKDKGIAPEYVMECSSAGYLQCGICKCNETRYGDDCRCEGTHQNNNLDDINKCKQNKSDILPCSSRGKCVCGKCECEGASGDFCQFDNKMCGYVNGKLCAGHGDCYLGKCVCHAGWRHDKCSCTEDTTTCIAPYSKEICSGNGVCECGKCVKCNKVPGKNEIYKGEFCDLCEDCDAKRCQEIERYAVCNFEHEKSWCDINEKYAKTQSIVVRVVPRNETRLPENSDSTQVSCEAKYKDDSIIKFKIFYREHTSHLIIQKEAELPPKANIKVAIGSAVGSVLLIGLLTLIVWKLVVDWLDKREYEKFSEEAKAAGYTVEDNPIYAGPAVRFSNPVYRNRQNK